MTRCPRLVYSSTKTSQDGASRATPTYFRSPQRLFVAMSVAVSSKAYASPHQATAASSTASAAPAREPRRHPTYPASTASRTPAVVISTANHGNMTGIPLTRPQAPCRATRNFRRTRYLAAPPASEQRATPRGHSSVQVLRLAPRVAGYAHHLLDSLSRTLMTTGRSEGPLHDAGELGVARHDGPRRPCEPRPGHPLGDAAGGSRRSGARGDGTLGRTRPRQRARPPPHPAGRGDHADLPALHRLVERPARPGARPCRPTHRQAARGRAGATRCHPSPVSAPPWWPPCCSASCAAPPQPSCTW